MSRVADDSNVAGDWDKSKTPWNSCIHGAAGGEGVWRIDENSGCLGRAERATNAW